MPPKVLSAQSLAEKAGVEPSVVGPGAIVPTSSSAPHPAARAPEKERGLKLVVRELCALVLIYDVVSKCVVVLLCFTCHCLCILYV